MMRRKDDYYATPTWCVDAILPELGPLQGCKILEPQAGHGAIVRALHAAGADRIYAHDLNPDMWAIFRELDGVVVATSGDFLLSQGLCQGVRMWPAEGFDLIVMNPPYSDAARHVEHALTLLACGGSCAALLRLGFLCSGKRADFRRRRPCDVFPLVPRPSFTGGGTDSSEYAWFIWGPGRGNHYRVLEKPSSEDLFCATDKASTPIEKPCPDCGGATMDTGACALTCGG